MPQGTQGLTNILAIRQSYSLRFSFAHFLCFMMCVDDRLLQGLEIRQNGDPAHSSWTFVSTTIKINYFTIP
jgi:hypothetical protein